MYVIDKTQKVNLSLKDTWQFFSNPNNLSKITPKELDFTITNNPESRIYAGQIITYTVSPFLGIPMKWVTEIKGVEENKYFVDSQLVGPYAVWHHEHFFTETDGGTIIRDLVHYKLPLEPFSKVGHFIVKKQLDNIFNYRSKVISEIL